MTPNTTDELTPAKYENHKGTWAKKDYQRGNPKKKWMSSKSAD